MPDIKQRAHKMFDERFFRIKFGDGTANGGGKGSYLVPKENLSLDEVKSFIDEIIDMRDKEIVEEILSSFEALDKAGQSFPMAIIHWSKKDRENWVKSILSAEALNIK